MKNKVVVAIGAVLLIVVVCSIIYINKKNDELASAEINNTVDYSENTTEEISDEVSEDETTEEVSEDEVSDEETAEEVPEDEITSDEATNESNSTVVVAEDGKTWVESDAKEKYAGMTLDEINEAILKEDLEEFGDGSTTTTEEEYVEDYNGTATTVNGTADRFDVDAYDAGESKYGLLYGYSDNCLQYMLDNAGTTEFEILHVKEFSDGSVEDYVSINDNVYTISENANGARIDNMYMSRDEAKSILDERGYL